MIRTPAVTAARCSFSRSNQRAVWYPQTIVVIGVRALWSLHGTNYWRHPILTIRFSTGSCNKEGENGTKTVGHIIYVASLDPQRQLTFSSADWSSRPMVQLLYRATAYDEAVTSRHTQNISHPPLSTLIHYLFSKLNTRMHLSLKPWIADTILPPYSTNTGKWTVIKHERSLYIHCDQLRCFRTVGFPWSRR